MHNTAQNAVIQLKNVSVRLDGGLEVLHNLTVAVPKGRICGVIGPSGAGKTTLIRSIVGSQTLAQGTIAVLGEPAGAAGLRTRVTYMPQALAVYPDLTVRENIAYFVTLAGLKGRAAEDEVAKVLHAVELADKADALSGDLSGGQKQRVSLAVALIGSPELMVLDEPTVGLDPVLRRKLWDLFRQLAGQGVTLVVSSHSMDEAERCDDLLLVRDGHILAYGPPAQLRKGTGAKTIEAAFLKLVGAGK